jgi:hypothetical protein
MLLALIRLLGTKLNQNKLYELENLTQRVSSNYLGRSRLVRNH